MSWVVVLLAGSECDVDPNTRCVMEVLGPFDTRDTAIQARNQCDEWTTPHLMRLHLPQEDVSA